jgi:hypothetical protein
MRIERISTAILLASLCAPAVFAASATTAAHKSGKTSGNIFDGSKPQANPRECWITVITTEDGRDVSIATDQAFRATGQGTSVPEVGPRYLAFHFTIPSGFAMESGGDATTDDGYKISASPDAKAAKAGEEGVTKLNVKFEGQDNSIIKESAEISLTREFVPVRVRVDALTKTPGFNRESKLTCEQFTPIDIPPPPEPEQVQKAAASTQEVFWQSLQDLCGKAFAHIQDTPVASTPILDVRRCTDTSVLFGVHYLKAGAEPEWNRGQTWLITRMPDGLHMKYTRTESADPGAKQGGWSATTRDAGTSDLQIFAPDEATVAASPALKNFGWALKLQQGDAGGARFVYQAVEKLETGEQARGGYAFDLSTPIDPPAEAPWGMPADVPAPPAAPAVAAPAPDAVPPPAPAPVPPAPPAP